VFLFSKIRNFSYNLIHERPTDDLTELGQPLYVLRTETNQARRRHEPGAIWRTESIIAAMCCLWAFAPAEMNWKEKQVAFQRIGEVSLVRAGAN
jgi:hypothetical protein